MDGVLFVSRVHARFRDLRSKQARLPFKVISHVLMFVYRWLKTGGVLYPSRAILFLAPVSLDQLYEEKFNSWADFYGLDFSPLIPALQQKALKQPEIMILSPTQLLAPPQVSYPS